MSTTKSNKPHTILRRGSARGDSPASDTALVSSGGAPTLATAPEVEVDTKRTENAFSAILAEAANGPSGDELAVDRAVLSILRRHARVLLVLLDVWTSAVGDHCADEVGATIYNALKSSSDILFQVRSAYDAAVADTPPDDLMSGSSS